MPVASSLLQSKVLLVVSAVAVGAVAAPLLGQSFRPVLRNLVKAGLRTERRLATLIAGLREDVQDVVAEAKEQVAAEDSIVESSVPEHAHATEH